MHRPFRRDRAERERKHIADVDQNHRIHLNPPGGTLKLSIPPGSFCGGDARLRVKVAESLPKETASSAGAPVKGTGIGLEIDLEKGCQPQNFAGITMNYRASDIALLDPDSLVIARFDESKGIWLLLPSRTDLANKRVFGNTNHFSRFQLMGVNAALNVDQAVANPNPVRFSRGHTKTIFSNLSVNASVKIYTYLGELVRELRSDSRGGQWDGRNGK